MPNERPTGEDLVEELRVAAAAIGVSLVRFVEPIASGKGSPYLTQLRIAKLPTPLTIARVRALIGGRPIPSHRGGSNPGGRRHGNGADRPPESRIPGDMIAARRALAELAHENRLPGETVAAAVRRLKHSQATISDLGRN